MKETMRQQLMTQPKQITFRTVPVPEPGPDQVLVKIKKLGVCGSDIHVYHGTHPYTSYPVTQGHEVSAKVVRFGAKAMKKSLSTLMVIARAESDSRFTPTAVANWLLLL